MKEQDLISTNGRSGGNRPHAGPLGVKNALCNRPSPNSLSVVRGAARFFLALCADLKKWVTGSQPHSLRPQSAALIFPSYNQYNTGCCLECQACLCDLHFVAWRARCKRKLLWRHSDVYWVAYLQVFAIVNWLIAMISGIAQTQAAFCID